MLLIPLKKTLTNEKKIHHKTNTKFVNISRTKKTILKTNNKKFILLEIQGKEKINQKINIKFEYLLEMKNIF